MKTKLFSILTAVALSLSSVQALADGIAFTDLPSDHWAYGPITALSEQNVINGMGDGTFQPSGNVTREQFIKLLIGAYKYGGETDNVLMPADCTPEDWSYSYIRSAVVRKIIDDSSLTNGLFEPKKSVTRGDAIIWLANSLNTTAQKPCPFPDVKDTATKNAVAIATEAGLIGGFADSTFRPNNTLTRAESAIIIARLLGISDKVAYPEIDTKSYHEVVINAVDSRNSWSIDGVHISVSNSDGEVTYGTTNSAGKLYTYLKNGEYYAYVTNSYYQTSNVPFSVDGKDIAVTLSLTPVTSTDFQNIYVSMSDDERLKMVSDLNMTNAWLTVPDEYNYKTGYKNVLANVLKAAPYFAEIGFSATPGNTNSTKVNSNAERVDSFIAINYALKPNHDTKIDDIALSYKDGFWNYNLSATSLGTSLKAVPEAVYTADNKYFYLKYTLSGSAETRYAIVYKTAFDFYQILWASRTMLKDDDLKAFIEQADKDLANAYGDKEYTTELQTKYIVNDYPIDGVQISIFDAKFNKVGEGASDENGKLTTTQKEGMYYVYMMHPDYFSTWSIIQVDANHKINTISLAPPIQ